MDADEEYQQDRARDSAEDALLDVTVQRDELLAACKVLITSITEIIDAQFPASTDWVNVRAAVHLGRTAIANAEDM